MGSEIGAALASEIVFGIVRRRDAAVLHRAGDILDLLGLLGDLGNGLLFFIGRIAGLGADPVQFTTADYGTKFIVVAGLLNVISAVDAHNLRTGRKES